MSGGSDGDVVVVVGTRPEAVKLLPVVRRLGGRARIMHTGQHFDATLWSAVAGDLGLPEPAHAVAVGGRSRGEQIGEATSALTRHLLAHPATAVIVQGDTNSTLGGALAGNATGTPVVHVEAGLRSGDLTMPEESNRLLTDRIADVCCAPTEHNARVLLAEGIAPERVVVTGNTLAESVGLLLPGPGERAAVLARLGLTQRAYALATVHRAANVDHAPTLRALLGALADLAAHAPVLLPLHPHTRARVQQFGLGELLDALTILPPLPPRSFLALEHGARLLVSDSGGVQEEAALLGVPLLVLRDSTERSELLDGWCRLLGANHPRVEVGAAWSQAPDWRRRIAAAPPPYPAHGAADAVVAALDALAGAVAA